MCHCYWMAPGAALVPHRTLQVGVRAQAPTAERRHGAVVGPPSASGWGGGGIRPSVAGIVILTVGPPPTGPDGEIAA